MWKIRIDCGREKGNLLLNAENGDNSEAQRKKAYNLTTPNNHC